MNRMSDMQIQRRLNLRKKHVENLKEIFKFLLKFIHLKLWYKMF